jgi:hypothetical protein
MPVSDALNWHKNCQAPQKTPAGPFVPPAKWRNMLVYSPSAMRKLNARLETQRLRVEIKDLIIGGEVATLIEAVEYATGDLQVRVEMHDLCSGWWIQFTAGGASTATLEGRPSAPSHGMQWHERKKCSGAD